MRRFAVLAASVAVVLATVLASASSEAATQGRWVVRDLGPCDPFFHGCDLQSLEINESGQIAGVSGRKAFVWQSGTMRYLGTLGGPRTNVNDLNDRGQVVGWSQIKGGAVHAFLWEKGRMRDLGTLGGPESSALAINERGQIVGGADTRAKDEYGGPIRHAFLWQDGKMRDLGTSVGAGQADDVNNWGWAVGTGGGRTFLWREGRTVPLGRRFDAVALNDRGQVLLQVDSGLEGVYLWEKGRHHVVTNNEAIHAALDQRGRVTGSYVQGLIDMQEKVFVWQQGRMKIVGRGNFRAANERGQIVGQPDVVDNPKPLLWENGKRIALPLLPGHSEGMPLALNERNQIVGWSGKRYGEGPDEALGDTGVRGRIVLWTYKP